MKYVIVITGASSGFGALTARVVASSGHTVYAGRRPQPPHRSSIASGLRAASSVSLV
jgi:NAD(P)-dependent dehydrogenase (short-subunit alcohol dehydrogenase family)